MAPLPQGWGRTAVDVALEDDVNAVVVHQRLHHLPHALVLLRAPRTEL